MPLHHALLAGITWSAFSGYLLDRRTAHAPRPPRSGHRPGRECRRLDVSKVLSDGGITVREETRQAIIAEANRFNYRPHASARNLRTQRTGRSGSCCRTSLIPSMPRSSGRRPRRGDRIRDPGRRRGRRSRVGVGSAAGQRTAGDGLIIAVSAKLPDWSRSSATIPFLCLRQPPRGHRDGVTVDDEAAGYLTGPDADQADRHWPSSGNPTSSTRRNGAGPASDAARPRPASQTSSTSSAPIRAGVDTSRR